MKKLLLITLWCLFLACVDDDDPAVDDIALKGEWVLSDISCYCTFDPEIDFLQTHIFFDTEEGSLTVTHNSEYNLFKKEGVYYYGGQGFIIDFADDTAYQFNVRGNQLILVYLDDPDIADDEVTYYFTRP